MKWSDLFALVGVKARDGEEPTALEARAEALAEAFPGDPDFLSAQLRAGHTVAEAVTDLRAGHQATLDTLRKAHSAALAEAEAKAKSLADTLAKTNSELAAVRALPHAGNSSIPTSPEGASPAPKAETHLSPGIAQLAGALATQLATKE